MLPVLALATLVLAAMGALAAPRLRSLVAYLVVARPARCCWGWAWAAQPTRWRQALFYLVNSTLVAGAWFLLADRIVWARGGHDRLLPRPPAAGWAPLGAAFFVAAWRWPACRRWPASWARRCCCRPPGAPMGAAGGGGVLAASLAMMVALARAGQRCCSGSRRGDAAGIRRQPGPWHRRRLPSGWPLRGLLLAVLACAVGRAAGAYTSQPRSSC
jgi:multicomponent K+:H+ antiporter subunit D